MYSHGSVSPAGPSGLHYNYQTIVNASAAGGYPFIGAGQQLPTAGAFRYQLDMRALAQRQPPQRRVQSPRHHALAGQKRLERKIKKPLMEKKRRERINGYLVELKDLLNIASPQLDQKLEKADILEMTVEYLRGQVSHKRPAGTDASTGHSSVGAFDAGYTECMRLAQRLLSAEGHGPLADRLDEQLRRCRPQALCHTVVQPDATVATGGGSVSPASDCENVSVPNSSPGLEQSTSFEATSPEAKQATKPTVWRPF